MVCAAVGAADRQYNSAMAALAEATGRAMRLAVLDSGHRLSARALFAVIRLMTRQPVVDAVKLAFYRKDFYGAGPLTNEAMRGPSQWSVGERELMAAFVAKANECPFCIRRALGDVRPLVRRRRESGRHTGRSGHRAHRRAAAGDAAGARQAQPRAQRRRRRHPAGVGRGRHRCADRRRPCRQPRLQHHRTAGQRLRLRPGESRRDDRRCRSTC